MPLHQSLTAGRQLFQTSSDEHQRESNYDDRFVYIPHPSDLEEKISIFPTLEARLKSAELLAFRGQQFVWGQLKVRENERSVRFLPTHPRKNWQGANLKFSVINSTMRRCVRLSLIIENPQSNIGDRPDLQMEALWHFGRTYQNGNQIGDFKYTEVLNQDVNKSNAPRDDEIMAIDVSWESQGATVVGYNAWDQTWSKETKDLVRSLLKLRDPQAITLRLPHFNKDENNKISAIRGLVREEPKGLIPKDSVADPPFWQWLRLSKSVDVAYGAMLGAEILHRRQPFIPIPVPASLHFCDTREAEIKLGYGAYYEYELSQELSNALAKDEHKFGFVKMSKEDYAVLVVVIKLNKKNLPPRCVANFKIDEGTILEASCKVDGVGSERVELLLYVMDNVFNISAGDADIVASVVGESIDIQEFNGVASAYPKPPKTQYDGRFELKKNTAGIRRSLSAIHELFGVTDKERVVPKGKHERWWDLALNHDNNCDLVQVIPNCEQELLDKVTTKACQFLQHNEQKIPLRLINQLPRATGVIVGPPGTGKTLTGVTIGICYFQMGGHVMFSAPTNASADTLLLILVELLKRFELSGKCKIVRAYRSHLEREETHKGNPPGRDPEDNKATRQCRRTRDKKATEKGQDTQEPLQATVDTAHEAIEIQVILQLMKENQLKLFAFSEYSLARQMMERARSGVDGPCMIKYKPKDKTEQEEEFDVWKALREYVALMDNPDTYFQTWTEEAKARYAVCCRYGNAEVMRDADVVIATGNNMGCDVITQNFGEKAKFIVKIEDESAMMPEPDTWIGITKLRAYEKIRGLWLIGDYAQLSPLVLSTHNDVNPFASQLELSLFARLYLSKFPHFELVLSGRMHRDILAFPNTRTYRGKLRSTIAANERDVPDSYKSWYMDYFKDDNFADCRLFAVLVEGECTKSTNSESKFNLESAAYTCDMVNHMRDKGAFPVNDIVILTSYGHQKALLNKILKHMAIQLGLSRDAFPKVKTVDSFQSKQARMVIFDSVVTNKLGFLDNENRMNMCCTRAMSVFIIIGSRKTREVSRNSAPEGKHVAFDNFPILSRRHTTQDGELYYHESPYLADYLRWLTTMDLVFDARDLSQRTSWKAIQAKYSVSFDA